MTDLSRRLNAEPLNLQVRADAETARPEYEMPAEVSLRAIEHGVRAEQAFIATWQDEQKAYQHEAAEHPPAAWLAEDPCPVWCAGGPDHVNSAHPDDRVHFSHAAITPLVTMPYEAAGYPARFLPPELTVSLDLNYREKEPRVTFSADDGALWYKATLAEAQKIAHDILMLIAQARGFAPHLCLDGPCPDVACRICYPDPAPAVSST